MANPINKKALNSIQNELNYNSVKRGESSGNLANFATLRGCNLAGNWLFQVFSCGFLYARLESTNQQNLKKIWDIKGKKCAIWRGMAHTCVLTAAVRETPRSARRRLSVTARRNAFGGVATCQSKGSSRKRGHRYLLKKTFGEETAGHSFDNWKDRWSAIIRRK